MPRKCPASRPVFDPVENRCVKRNRKNKLQAVIVGNSAQLDAVLKQQRASRKAARVEAKRQAMLAKEYAAKRAALRARFIAWGASLSWSKRQGQPGFNAYAYERMVKAGIPSQLMLECPAAGAEPKPMAYQTTVSYLMQPFTNIDRLLVVARTGSGKTYTMIRVLENYFLDRRPKILVFPNTAVANNFYEELMYFPSKYRDLIRSKLGTAKPTVQAVTELMQNSKKSGLPSILLSLSYARAGGATFLKRFKTYSNTIICMDEFHNLVAPPKEMARYKKQLGQLKAGLKAAKGAKIVGFTATPFVHTPVPGGKDEGAELMQIIKGDNAPVSDEGYVCYYNSMPSALYPTMPPNKPFGDVIHVDIPVLAVKKYEQKKKELAKSGKACVTGDFDAKCAPLQNYANMPAYYAQYKNYAPDAKMLKQHRPGATREPGLAKNFFKDPNLISPKFQFLLELLKRNQRKSLVLVERHAGYKAVADIVKEANLGCDNGCKGFMYEKKGSQSTLNAFNSPDNLTGDKMRYMVADAKEFSEGISFFAVRDLYLVNPPMDYGRYLQQIGRVLRSCRHNALPKDQRTINIYILVTKSTIDQEALVHIKQEAEKYNSAMMRFKSVAVDRLVLDRFFGL